MQTFLLALILALLLCAAAAALILTFADQLLPLIGLSPEELSLVANFFQIATGFATMIPVIYAALSGNFRHWLDSSLLRFGPVAQQLENQYVAAQPIPPTVLRQVPQPDLTSIAPSPESRPQATRPTPPQPVSPAQAAPGTIQPPPEAPPPPESQPSDDVSQILVFLLAAALLGRVWYMYKGLATILTIVLASIGALSSAHFLGFLRGYTLEGKLTVPVLDRILAWGSMPIWILGATGSLLGYYGTLIPRVAIGDQVPEFLRHMDELIVAAGQLLGAVMVLLALLAVVLFQTFRRRLYSKATRNQGLNWLDRAVWVRRWQLTFGIPLAATWGFALLTGGIWRIIPLYPIP